MFNTHTIFYLAVSIFGTIPLTNIIQLFSSIESFDKLIYLLFLCYYENKHKLVTFGEEDYQVISYFCKFSVSSLYDIIHALENKENNVVCRDNKIAYYTFCKNIFKIWINENKRMFADTSQISDEMSQKYQQLISAKWHTLFTEDFNKARFIPQSLPDLSMTVSGSELQDSNNIIKRIMFINMDLCRFFDRNILETFLLLNGNPCHTSENIKNKIFEMIKSKDLLNTLFSTLSIDELLSAIYNIVKYVFCEENVDDVLYMIAKEVYLKFAISFLKYISFEFIGPSEHSEHGSYILRNYILFFEKIYSSSKNAVLLFSFINETRIPVERKFESYFIMNSSYLELKFYQNHKLRR